MKTLHIGMNPGPIIYDETGEQIADCRAVGFDTGGDMTYANLFAAAPDLLAACRRALSVMETPECAIYRAHTDIVRAAIARATRAE